MKKKTKKILGITLLTLALVTAVGAVSYGISINTKGVDQTNNDILRRDTLVNLKINSTQRYLEKLDTKTGLYLLNKDKSTGSTISEYKEAVDTVNKSVDYNNKIYGLMDVHLVAGDKLNLFNKSEALKWQSANAPTYSMTPSKLVPVSSITDGILEYDSFNNSYKSLKDGRFWFGFEFSVADDGIETYTGTSNFWFVADPVKA